MSAAAIPLHLERDEPGFLGSFVLAAAVHLVLFAVLFFGVRWQSRSPELVSVELWVPPVAVVERAETRPEPAPRLEPPRTERPDARPEPKPEPKPQVLKPDIAIKDSAKPKPKPEPAPKPEAKRTAGAREDEMRSRLREQLAHEETAIRLDRERRSITEQLTRDAAAARQRGLAAYADKIKAKIRGNIVLPPDLKGNPEATFEVVQLPTGEVLPPQLKKSSGHRGYDEAVERAILKSSPLPKPDRPEDFRRNLELKFRPQD